MVKPYFTPLREKLQLVRSYPGITDVVIDKALHEAQASGLLARYEAERRRNATLDAVVSVYLDTVPATFLYARDIADRNGCGYHHWYEDIDHTRIRLMKGVPDHRNCVKIEVLDLAANWHRGADALVPKRIRDRNSAHAAVIYAAAQNPELMEQMDGECLPRNIILGGYEFNMARYHPDEPPWSATPTITGDNNRRIRALGDRAGGLFCASLATLLP